MALDRCARSGYGPTGRWQARPWPQALCDGGARERFYHEVAEAHLARIIRVDMDSEIFTCDINEQALARAKLMDGKLLLTNVKDLTPPEIVKRYKSLAHSDSP